MNAILWRRLDRPGCEAARLRREGDGWELSGTAAFAHDGSPCSLSYRVLCDAAWRTRHARVTGWLGGRSIDCEVSVDGEGGWRINGNACPQVDGCIDLDLNFSPSTNLLPVRRLQLAIGETGAVRAAWLTFPAFELEPLEQQYHHLAPGVYRYESGGGTFRTQLRVDPAGLVTLYPGFAETEAQA